MNMVTMANLFRRMGYTVWEYSKHIVISLAMDDVTRQDIYDLTTMDDRVNVQSVNLLRHTDDDSFDRVSIIFK